MDQNRGYNTRYTNGGHAFENTLLDALMLFEEGNAKKLLIGGIEEISNYNYNIDFLADHYKEVAVGNFDLIDSLTKGSVCGEGSNMFIVESAASEYYAKIEDVEQLTFPKEKDIELCINSILENKINNNDIYENRENIKAILRSISNKTNDYNADIYNFKVLIINSDLSIDKIILNNNIIIKFKKQSIITINLLLDYFDIKNIVFSEDINGEEYIFTIKNDLHKYFVEDMKNYNIEIEKFKIIKENKNISKGKIKFIDNILHDNILLDSDYFSKYHKYVMKNEQNVKKMYEIRKYIKDKLLSNIYTDEYYNNLSKNKRIYIIGTLLKNILSNSNNNLYNKKELQIVLEEINASSRTDIKNWFSMSLEKFKYDYINDISENIIETDNE